MIFLPPARSHFVQAYFRVTGFISPVRYVISMTGLVAIAMSCLSFLGDWPDTHAIRMEAPNPESHRQKPRVQTV
jgi:hypothetical protein